MWKTKLAIVINFLSSKDKNEGHLMHSEGHNIEIMIKYKADKVMEELFQLFLSRC